MVEDSREVVKCGHCQLVQFRTCSGNCRRCFSEIPQHVKLDERSPVELLVSEDAVKKISKELRFGDNLKLLRVSFGYSQGDLAVKLSSSRTYVCRIEIGSQEPGLEFIERISECFSISTMNLMSPNLGGWHWIFDDPYMVEIARLMPGLTARRREIILSAVKMQSEEVARQGRKNGKLARRRMNVLKQQANNAEAHQDAASPAGPGTNPRLPAGDSANNQIARPA